MEYPAIHRSILATVVLLRKSFVCCAAFFCCVAATGVVAPLAAADAVLRIEASTVEVSVAVELPAGMTVDAASPWQLVEEGSDVTVPAQIGAAISGDGTPATGRQRLLAVIPPGGDGVESRKFRLTTANAAASAAFNFTDKTPASLQLREGEQPVFVYNHGVVTREDIPQQEHRRSRGCYIHPLYGLSGEVLTDDFPQDHYHHHGVFWTWPHVLVAGQAHDLWAGATIAQKFRQWLVRESGPVAAVLAVENGWYVGEELVMVERIWMRAFRAGQDERALDLELFFTPAKPLTLQGAEGKSYGGLTVRFAPGARAETLITVPSGPTTDDLPDTRLAWADFTSRFAPLEHRSGAAILVSPRHPDYPPAWLTRHYGAMCVGYPGVQARSFEAGKPFQLDYRLWLHRQAAAFEQLEAVRRGYAQAVAAQWEDMPNPDTAELPPRTVSQQVPRRPIPEWLQTHLRIGHLPGSLPMAEQFLKAGYNVVTLNVLGNWEIVGPSADAYPAERVRQAETYMRTHVERCHAAGAKAIFYVGPVQVPSGNEIFAKAHPDWLRIRSNGQPDPTPNFANIRSGYADWLLTQLAYVTREFKVDGFWFDGYAPVHLHTYDEATKSAFREFSGGHEIPQPIADAPNSPMYFDPTHDAVTRLYLRWHEDHFVRFADRMREAIRQANPEAVIYVNHSANRTWYFPNMYMGEYPVNYSSAVDVSSVELYWDVPGDPLYQQFVYAFLQGITHERGASVWIQPSAHGISGISSPVEIQLRGIECLPWGVNPEFVESTGREEYCQLHVANMRAREEWLKKSRAVPYIGIVASEQTRTLYAQGALPLYFSHTLGAFRSYLEKHVPVRVLTEYDLEDADLQGIRVLVLPNVACMSDRAAEVVRRFVRGGGGLTATFETSLYDENYQKRPDFALGDLFKARYVSTHTVTQRVENLYLTLDAPHPILDDPLIQSKRNNAWLTPGQPPDQGPLALVASATKVTPLDGGQVVSTYNVNLPAAESQQRHPAIVVSEYGRGRVVYFPASVDKGMFFYPDTYMRQMLANAARWAAREAPPLVEVAGPLILTTTVRTQPDQQRTVVHLLNQASSWGIHSTYQKLAALPEELNKQWGFPNQSELRGTWPVREEIIPLHDIIVTCRVPGVHKATQQPEGLDLPLRQTADGVEVTVPTVGMHSMVVFE